MKCHYDQWGENEVLKKKNKLRALWFNPTVQLYFLLTVSGTILFHWESDVDKNTGLFKPTYLKSNARPKNIGGN